MLADLFHPLTAGWFAERFGQPTEPQKIGWPAIRSGPHTLIAAPTGSGKTLAAFLTSIDDLVCQAAAGRLEPRTQVVYVSPLRALSNDIHRNLEGPLAEILARAAAEGCRLEPFTAGVRTGDTSASERAKLLRQPPHILVTTPETLYLMLTAAKARETLRGVRTVIVDEIHALARDKRGSHLALSLARLDALADVRPVRIGLSATQRPIEEVARYLVGSGNVAADGRPNCRIVDVGHTRQVDLDLVLPPSPLSAVCSHEQWAEIYERLTSLIAAHRSTLVFVNTRRMAERLAHQLAERLGSESVASHHGSLAKELRLASEERLKRGELKAIVATASLELGIDVGYIDLVCQVGSPRSIAVFLQRVGRSGHALGLVPKGRLFPLTRDGLVECLALVRAVRARRLDAVKMPRAPLDILAQQIVAAVAAEEWDEQALFDLCRAAWPFHELGRGDFERIVEMLASGVVRGHRRGAYLHRDQVAGRLRPRRSARLAAITSGGAIPDLADYRVVTEDEGTVVGTVNEDFAIESSAGDIFLLGNTSWRIRQVRGGDVVVSDAQGAPATIPFWLGEAPGRTPELSREVSELRREVAARLMVDAPTPGAGGDLADLGRAAAAEVDDDVLQARRGEVGDWLAAECGVSLASARPAVDYIASEQVALGLIPSQERVVFERFFDESGGMQLVVHAPFGVEVNRAWGLALRKRFCRSFNFELQAAADDNGLLLSLGPQHSFPLDDMFRLLHPENARHLLVQALLAAPMFLVRWRWNATRALAVLRFQGGKKVPPPMQRFRADDLLSAVFPETTGCLENVVGDITVPDHPLVEQTVHDCLTEAMDLDRWLSVLGRIAGGQIELVPRDTREPSPFAHELLNAQPYAFLDDAPLEERRARAVATRRSISPEELGDLAWLDPEAMAQVRREAWPLVRDADELADLLQSVVAWPVVEGEPWRAWYAELELAGRATTLTNAAGRAYWVGADRLTLALAAFPEARPTPPLALPPALSQPAEPHVAWVALVRGRTELVGPVSEDRLADDLSLGTSTVRAALEALEAEGCVLRGHFTPGEKVAGDSGPNGSPSAPPLEWCDRRLLARIHRLTLAGARRQIEPVPPEVFWQFLCDHQHVSPRARLAGPEGLAAVLGQLAGCEAPAGSWEVDLLPWRLHDYDPAWLDELAHDGRLAWGRLDPPHRPAESGPSHLALHRGLPLGLLLRRDLAWLLPTERAGDIGQARSAARQVYEALASHGALFAEELAWATGLLPAHVEEALGELVALGLASCDGWSPLRRLVADQRRTGGRSRRAVRAPRSGRWLRFPPLAPPVAPAERVERWADLLLNRWGVVCRDLVLREPLAPPWWELVRVYRRREARGEIRGGRFVGRLSGEQYARAEVISPLRALRTAPPREETLVISAADPLNLTGLWGDVPRLAAQRTATLALRDGRVIATQSAGEIRFWAEVADDEAVRLSRGLQQNGLARLHAAQATGPLIDLRPRHRRTQGEGTPGLQPRR